MNAHYQYWQDVTWEQVAFAWHITVLPRVSVIATTSPIIQHPEPVTLDVTLWHGFRHCPNPDRNAGIEQPERYKDHPLKMYVDSDGYCQNRRIQDEHGLDHNAWGTALSQDGWIYPKSQANPQLDWRFTSSLVFEQKAALITNILTFMVHKDLYLGHTVQDYPAYELKAMSDISERPWVMEASQVKRGARRVFTSYQVARGAGADMFFQWRASKAGAEHHSSVHGTDRVCVKGLNPFSLHFHDRDMHQYYKPFEHNIDFDPEDLSKNELVIAPNLYLVNDAAVYINQYVENGGNLDKSFFSGIVDENEHIRLAAPFRELGLVEYALPNSNANSTCDVQILATSGIRARSFGQSNLRILQRSNGTSTWLFVLNHSTEGLDNLAKEQKGKDLLTGTEVIGSLKLEPR
nr:beta-galactosidase [uncultured bacterium]